MKELPGWAEQECRKAAQSKNRPQDYEDYLQTARIAALEALTKVKDNYSLPQKRVFTRQRILWSLQRYEQTENKRKPLQLTSEVVGATEQDFSGTEFDCIISGFKSRTLESLFRAVYKESKPLTEWSRENRINPSTASSWHLKGLQELRKSYQQSW